uniref:Uncharacterized protein n=1 Tax=Coccidioides posadasii RMSCC 3488 TaxID=454284 RepID=A0A0J6FED5_COCPO|nr:hypothetical protein CPAG_07823 [Coccidioides posadasii RMSCC 3488]
MSVSSRHHFHQPTSTARGILPKYITTMDIQRGRPFKRTIRQVSTNRAPTDRRRSRPTRLLPSYF